MTGDLLEECRLAMIFIDKDRDNILDEKEFGQLVDRLRPEVKGAVSYKKATKVYDAYYEVLAEAHGSNPSLEGSKPSQIPSDEEAEVLEEICQTTFDAMQEAMLGAGGSADEDDEEDENADVLVKNTVVGDDGEEDDSGDKGEAFELDAAVMADCKRAIYVSDRDRNGGLDVDEFVFLLNRLLEEQAERDGTEATYEVFGDLHDAFHVIYRDMSTYDEYANAFLVSAEGSRPGAGPTDEENDHLESLCQAVYFTFEELLLI
jgi:hypothetical protein